MQDRQPKLRTWRWRLQRRYQLGFGWTLHNLQTERGIVNKIADLAGFRFEERIPSGRGYPLGPQKSLARLLVVSEGKASCSLDSVVDEIGEEKSHPHASLKEIVGILIEMVK
jgi:hypothetical protein